VLLDHSAAYQSFAGKQKAQYHDMLSRLRAVIRDLSQDTSREQLGILTLFSSPSIVGLLFRK
jgi:hypothetical protein